MTFHKINLSKTVIVFDLDDTLYREIDYQSSGFREVSKYLKENYKINISYQFIQKCIREKKNVLEEICKKFNLKKQIAKSLLWIYRLHKPKIYLKKSIKQTIKKLEKRSAGVAILTDGRSITQRLKLKALGVNYLPHYISEDYNETKPSLKRFKLIMKEIPAQNYVYVGDNVSKDFLAPNKLKWLTIGLKKNNYNIHKKVSKNKDKDYQPLFWINKLPNLFKYLQFD